MNDAAISTLAREIVRYITETHGDGRTIAEWKEAQEVDRAMGLAFGRVYTDARDSIRAYLHQRYGINSLTGGR